MLLHLETENNSKSEPEFKSTALNFKAQPKKYKFSICYGQTAFFPFLHSDKITNFTLLIFSKKIVKWHVGQKKKKETRQAKIESKNESLVARKQVFNFIHIGNGGNK